MNLRPGSALVLAVFCIAVAPRNADAQIGSFCLRPIGIPDKWVENQTPPWDPTDTFSPTGSNPDFYLDGYRANEDQGTPLALRVYTGSTPNGQSALAVRTGLSSGGAAFRDAMVGCSGILHSVGDSLQGEPGNLIGPLGAAVADLLALDPNAIWDPTANDGAGGVISSAFPHSPRIIPLPVFAPSAYVELFTFGTPPEIRKIVGFFITGQSSGVVNGRLTGWSELMPSGVSARPAESVQLSATITGAGFPIVNLPVDFLVDDVVVATAYTDGAGNARLETTAYNTGDRTPGQYADAIRVRLGENAGFFTAPEATADLTILKKVPVLTWDFPTDIVYGTSLSPTQLNASADAPGIFAYTPPGGTVLSAGSGQPLTAAFTPADDTLYESGTTRTSLTVTPAPLLASVTSASKVYLDPLPAFTYTIGGFVNGDTATVVTGTAAFQTAATATSPVGTYPVGLSGLSASNYTISVEPGTLSIVPRSTATALEVPVPSSTTYGQTFSITANVSSDLGVPTGTVALLDAGTPVATSALVNGQASFSLTTLSAGSHTLSSSYSGDAGYSASSSGTRSLTVARASTTTSLTSSLNPSRTGQVVTLTSRVAPVAPGGGIPTGSVEFLRNGVVVATVTLTNGEAVLTTSTLAVGKHQFQARYVASTNYLGSVSAVVQQTVKGGGK